MGGFGGGSLEYSRQWLGAQWAGFSLRGPSWQERLGAPRGGRGAELGHSQGGALTTLRCIIAASFFSCGGMRVG
eukprot:scaffold8918_cov59-Phaeocystis_antarctica.AAC.9